MESKLDEKVFKYRKRHPKCKFCKYFRSSNKGLDLTFFECLAKDKILHDWTLDMPKYLCGCYEVKDVY